MGTKVAIIGGGAAAAFVITELLEHGVELGLEQLAVALHQGGDVAGVFQEAHVAQLVDLVRADAADAGVGGPPGDVGRRRCQRGQAGAGPGDLGGGGEHEGAVGVAGLGAFVQDFGEGNALFTEVVFSWPGIGLQIYSSIVARDLPVVQAAVLVTTFVFVIVNLGTDVVVAALDPRIRRA